MWMDGLYTNKQLEDNTKSIYQLFVNSKDSFYDSFERYFDISSKLTFGNMNIEDCVYELLNNYYRNEYYVKRAFKNKNLKNDSVLYEYPVNDSRADIVDIDKLTCYEIKTKYDNLDRLDKQINSYSKVFKYVYVVCSEDKISQVKDIIPSYCGIITYYDRKNCRFNLYKKATKSKYFDIYTMLKCCNKAELKKQFKTCDIDSIVKEYSIEYINDCYKNILSNRL